MNKITNNESKQKLSLTPIEEENIKIGLGVAKNMATQMMLQLKVLHKNYHRSAYELEKLKQYLTAIFPIPVIQTLLKPSGRIDDVQLTNYCFEAFEESNYNLFIPSLTDKE